MCSGGKPPAPTPPRPEPTPPPEIELDEEAKERKRRAGQSGRRSLRVDVQFARPSGQGLQASSPKPAGE